MENIRLMFILAECGDRAEKLFLVCTCYLLETVIDFVLLSDRSIVTECEVYIYDDVIQTK